MATFDICLSAETLFDRAHERRIDANARERAALARLCGAEACRAFTAELHIAPESPTRARFDLRFEAQLTQTCVVSLDPVDTAARDHYVATLILGGPGPDSGDAWACDEDEEEILFLEKNGVLDVGALLDELFVLSVNPYPRKEGARLEQGPFEGVTVIPAEDGEMAVARDDARKPFAGLDVLLRQKQGKS